MTRLELEIDGRRLATEMETDGRTVSLQVGEQTLSATVGEPEPGLFVVMIGNHVFRCARESLADGSQWMTVNGRRMRVEIHDRRDRRTHRSESDGPVKLSSPMPGKVVAVLAEVGDLVQPGQGILVVEAMKMQNEIQSPHAGRVSAIHVSIGQTVNSGEVLGLIEA